jgi:hypothetical protein
MDRPQRAFALVVLFSGILLAPGAQKPQARPQAADQGPAAFKPGEAVPKVEPVDLKAFWQAKQKLGGINADIAKKVCKPGADLGALDFRADMIWLINETEKERIAPWMKDGQPDDAVFRVAAKIPMNGMGVGTPHQSFPFDVDEFFRRLHNSKPAGPR